MSTSLRERLAFHNERQSANASTRLLAASIALLGIGVAGCTPKSSVGEPTASTSRATASATPRTESSSRTSVKTLPETSPLATPTSPNQVALPTGANEDFKIAQTFIVGFNASTPLATIEKVVRDTHIGGIYLTNTNDAAGLGFNKAYYAELGKAAGVPLIIASDEEGGEVHRLKYDFYFPSAAQMGQLSRAQVEQIAQRAGATMKADGVTMDLAPVLDVDNGLHDGAISGLHRSFSADVSVIASKADAFTQGLAASGISSVAKHFPGLGRATPNSNTDIGPAYAPPWASLEATDLRAYSPAVLSHVGAVMLSNEFVTGLGTPVPASISPAVVSYLRSNLGFQKLITTDSLSALSKYDGKTLDQNIAAAEAAGVNAPLFDYPGSEAGIFAAISAVKAAGSPTMIDSSLQLVLAEKAREQAH